MVYIDSIADSDILIAPGGCLETGTDAEIPTKNQ
jgi:hypothetical protein